MQKWSLASFAVGVVSCLAASVAWASPPMGVSPEGLTSSSCPTFSWALVEGASGYEVVVYSVGAVGEVASAPVLSATLPAGVSAWTPSTDRCLTPGSRFAWSVRALEGAEEEAWSQATLFEVAAAPSIGEVEAAIATLRRYLADRERNGPEPGAEVGLPFMQARDSEEMALPLRPALPGLTSADGPKAVMGASAPTLGSPSLTVDANIALGAASNLFKDGSVFLWDDTVGNLALGENALASATGAATENTAVGREALRYTVADRNTAVGDRALRNNTTGEGNTATGHRALFSNTTGINNTAIGDLALYNTDGYANVGLGYGAGYQATTGSNNIFLGTAVVGSSGDTNTIRIGKQGTQDATFIAGIHSGTDLSGTDIRDVCVNDAGQLGPCPPTPSSARFKEEITGLEASSGRLLELRPVSFRYREGVGDGGERVQFGLIAEEVAEVFPELVTLDAEGELYGVRYDLLSILLLDELQRAEKGLAEQRAVNADRREALEDLHRRLKALEEAMPAGEIHRPWWRRVFVRRE